MQPIPCTPLGRARQLLRRWSWLLLFATGLSLYPLQIYWQVRYATSQVTGTDRGGRRSRQGGGSRPGVLENEHRRGRILPD